LNESIFFLEWLGMKRMQKKLQFYNELLLLLKRWKKSMQEIILGAFFHGNFTSERFLMITEVLI